MVDSSQLLLRVDMHYLSAKEQHIALSLPLRILSRKEPFVVSARWKRQSPRQSALKMERSFRNEKRPDSSKIAMSPKMKLEI